MDRVQEIINLSQVDLSTLNIPHYKLQAILRNTIEIADLSLRIRGARVNDNNQADPLSCVPGHNIRGPPASVHIVVDRNLDPSSPISKQIYNLLFQVFPC